MWQTELVLLLRVLLDDTENVLKYSDNRLQQLLLVSARLVSTEINTRQTYTISISEGTLSPDPTETATQDDSFANLILLKSACIADNSIARKAAGKAFYVKEGPTAFDKRSAAAALLNIMERGWCAAYEQAKFEYAAGQVLAGQAILSPFRTVYSSLSNNILGYEEGYR